MKRLYEWYQQQEGIKKFGVSLLLNWVYWALMYFLIYFIIENHEKRTLEEYFITVSIAALLWTIVDIPFKKWLRRRNKDA